MFVATERKMSDSRDDDIHRYLYTGGRRATMIYTVIYTGGKRLSSILLKVQL